MTLVAQNWQSNGMVERTIQTVKRTLLKCLKMGDDKDLALLVLHTAPGKENTPSPATKLMKRELRTLLPRINEPTYRNKAYKETPRKHKKLLPLNIGDHVRLYEGKTWSRKGESNQEM